MIISIIKLVRLYYSLPLAGGLWVIAYYLAAGNLAGLYGRLSFAVAALWCVIAAGYIYNDVFDIEADRINKPSRPLAAGKVNRSKAMFAAAFLNTSGLILSLWAAFSFTLSIAAVIALLFVYNIFSKRIGLWKDILVAVLVVSLYPMAFAVSQPSPSPRLNVLYVHPLWLFLTTVAYQMLKDTLDIKGDMLISKTHLEYRGSVYFGRISRAIIFAAGLLTLVPGLYGWCGGIYSAAAITAVFLCAAATVLSPPAALRCVYAEVFIITAGSTLDLFFAH